MELSDLPAAKRAKSQTIESSSANSIDEARLQTTLDTTAGRAEFTAQKFNSAKPFRHFVMDDFFQDPSFTKVLFKEMVNVLTVKPKETDLFKFHQTDDIRGILQDESKELPALRAVAKKLYGIEFRNELEKACGLPEGSLTDKMDLAAQAYTKGDHLVCHDDVISTRKLTFVLYLDKCDDKWDCSKEGGGFELYDYEKSWQTPAKTIEPNNNRVCLFGVEPLKSYHAVQEVRTDDRVRLSLQGWYHVRTHEECYAPENRENASRMDYVNDRKHVLKAPKEQEGPAVGDKLADGIYLAEPHDDDRSDSDEDKSLGSSLEAGLSREESDSQVIDDRKGSLKIVADFEGLLPPESKDKSEITRLNSSSLKRLNQSVMAARKQEAASEALKNEEEEFERFLQLINPKYFEEKTQEEIRKTFVEKSEVLLCDFLDLSKVATYNCSLGLDDEMRTEMLTNNLLKDLQNLKAETAAKGWTLAGPPHVQRYKTYSGGSDPKESVAQFLLTKVMLPMMKSYRFGTRFLAKLTGLDWPHFEEPSGQKAIDEKNGPGNGIAVAPSRPEVKMAEARSFRPGTDYSIATAAAAVNSTLFNKELDCCYCLAKCDTTDAVDAWDCEDNGGFESYLEMDEEEKDDEKAAIYKDSSDSGAGGVGQEEEGNEDNGPLLNISPSFNALSLVLREEGVLSFLKFISSEAPSKRMDCKCVWSRRTIFN